MEMTTQPVILVTVYRRYFELMKNLRALHEMKSLFAAKPMVVVVWADPEVSRMWVFQQLLSEGVIDRVLTRPKMVGHDGVHGNTTYMESVNIRRGLDWVKSSCKKYYVLFLTADVMPTPTILQRADREMQSGRKAFVVYWPNPCAPGACYHTNFFAVSDDCDYWPPVVQSISEDDVLERLWWLKINRLSGIETFSNPCGKFFSHLHESEDQPETPHFAQNRDGDITLYMKGHQSWWKRLGVWFLRRFLKWQK